MRKRGNGYIISWHIGVSPSGKASDSESDISLVRIQLPQPISIEKEPSVGPVLIRLFFKSDGVTSEMGLRRFFISEMKVEYPGLIA